MMYVSCGNCKYWYTKDDKNGGVCINHLSTQFAVFIHRDYSLSFGCPCPEEE